MFNTHDLKRNQCMLTGSFKKKGYDWWWHSFTAVENETGKEVPFFVEYFVCNPGLGEDVPVLGQAKENKEAKKKPSYLMVKAGCWGQNKKQLHRFFSWKEVKLNYGTPYSLSAADCYASDVELKGSVQVLPEEAEKHPELMSDSGSMKWDLKLDKQVAFNVGYGAGGFFRAIKAFEMYWHAEGMKTLVSGTVELDGRKYTVLPEKSYGYSDKNWGRGFTSPWVWLSSSDIYSNIYHKKLENSVFDIGGGRPKVFCFPLERKLLSAFWYEGTPYEFNFSKFWTRTKTVFSFEETDTQVIWHVEQSNSWALMKTRVVCEKRDMLWVNYEDPCGIKKYTRLWNGGTGHGNVKLFKKHRGVLELIDDMEVAHIGCEYGEFDPSVID